MAVMVNKLKNIILQAALAEKRISMRKINGSEGIINGGKKKQNRIVQYYRGRRRHKASAPLRGHCKRCSFKTILRNGQTQMVRYCCWSSSAGGEVKQSVILPHLYSRGVKQSTFGLTFRPSVTLSPQTHLQNLPGWCCMHGPPLQRSTRTNPS